MSTAQLQDYVFTTKYARWLPEKQRRETFEEAVDRVCDMHATRYADRDIKDELEFVRAAMKDRLVLGSQRALQFGGAPILKKHARMYNCTTSYCNRPRFFQEAFWLLLCGCGTGFSVQTHHVAALPVLTQMSSVKRVYKIQDTIEGWADALGVLLASYGLLDGSMTTFVRDEKTGYQPEGVFRDYVGFQVDFDYSLIRPEGATISTGAGKAPGHAPLRAALESIRGLLDRKVREGDMVMRSINCYDVVMHASDAVLAGGVRRSATICLFSHDDESMLNAKSGNWMRENPQRMRSNNSAMLMRDEVTWEQYREFFLRARRNYGEPGTVWADNREITYNPCVEIGLYPCIPASDVVRLVTEPTGTWTLDDVLPNLAGDTVLYGWAFCNLSEINCKACTDEATWVRAAKAASMLGTLQCGYTDFGYLGPVSSAIAKREALLGVSLTGMMDNPKWSFDPAHQTKMAQLVLSTNAEFCAKVGVNSTARATCVKPSGTASLVLATASGIHAHHAKRYFRAVRANRTEEPARFFAAMNPRSVEVDFNNPRNVILTFPVEVDRDALTKSDVSSFKQLSLVKLTRENWVEAGRNPARCAASWLSHNVSNTITLRRDDEEAAARYIYDNRHAFAGISIFDEDGGDLDYAQAPLCSVKTEQELIDVYGRGVFMASGLIVDGYHAFGENLWVACDTATGRASAEDLSKAWIPEGYTPTGFKEFCVDVWKRKVDWVRRFKQFAVRYFAGDLEKCAMCLKDVHNFKRWQDIAREQTPVDYASMQELVDNTENPTLDPACAGGQCEIPQR